MNHNLFQTKFSKALNAAIDKIKLIMYEHKL